MAPLDSDASTRKIFQVQSVEDTVLCHPVNPDDFDRFAPLTVGQPQGAQWHPIAVRIIREDLGRQLHESDAPWSGMDVLILNSRAASHLKPILIDCGEFLPLICRDEDLVAFSATTVFSALDEQRSKLERFDDGRIMFVTRFVLRADRIGRAAAFRIDDIGSSPIFVTEEFVERWRSSQLKGLQFKPVDLSS
jgi:hypothetical protein